MLNNSMIADPPTKQFCERCENTGYIYVTWPRFRIYLIENYMAVMDEGRRRFCAMVREYHRWVREGGRIICDSCNK